MPNLRSRTITRSHSTGSRAPEPKTPAKKSPAKKPGSSGGGPPKPKRAKSPAPPSRSRSRSRSTSRSRLASRTTTKISSTIKMPSTAPAKLGSKKSATKQLETLRREAKRLESLSPSPPAPVRLTRHRSRSKTRSTVPTTTTTPPHTTTPPMTRKTTGKAQKKQPSLGTRFVASVKKLPRTVAQKTRVSTRRVRRFVGDHWKFIFIALLFAIFGWFAYKHQQELSTRTKDYGTLMWEYSSAQYEALHNRAKQIFW